MSLAFKKFQIHPAQFVYSIFLFHNNFPPKNLFLILSVRHLLCIPVSPQILSGKNSGNSHCRKYDHDDNVL